ncbi:RNA polymerase sigma factor [Flocculibacter collagenilyticus]|uniref:RNA polymerase sigma factor n=1 Tax=Flocculibacter collagenilyticus TaxID=2744479 RepID=UPI0018F496F8|nr:RNA polymerase sigma factor [Flocculibacter collagenilyticus]
MQLSSANEAAKTHDTASDVTSSSADMNEQAPQQLEWQTMAEFLSYIEKKAYRFAEFATGGHADAIDLLQDSMIKLVTKYQDKPATEWKALFYKILQNKVRDWHRQQKVKNMLFFWRNSDDETQEEWQAPDEDGSDQPEQELVLAQQQEAVLAQIKQLPVKQQQCFLLRSWEGMSVAETAEVMGCSQGSVKTHYFRAVTKIKALLEAKHEQAI